MNVDAIAVEGFGGARRRTAAIRSSGLTPERRPVAAGRNARRPVLRRQRADRLGGVVPSTGRIRYTSRPSDAERSVTLASRRRTGRRPVRSDRLVEVGLEAPQPTQRQWPPRVSGDWRATVERGISRHPRAQRGPPEPTRPVLVPRSRRHRRRYVASSPDDLPSRAGYHRQA